MILEFNILGTEKTFRAECLSYVPRKGETIKVEGERYKVFDVETELSLGYSKPIDCCFEKITIYLEENDKK